MFQHKLLLSFILIVFLISFTSAFSFDNVKSYDEIEKKVTITNAFGLGSNLAEIKLEENTNYCFTECTAIINATIYSDGETFLNEISFKNSLGGFKAISYKFEYISSYEEINVNDYETVCIESKEKNINGTYDNNCNTEIIGTHIEKVPIWSSINPKTTLKGDYVIKLTGYKSPEESIDWIPIFFGKEISEWAWWIGIEPTVYLKFDHTGQPTVYNDTTGRVNVSGALGQGTMIGGKINNSIRIGALGAGLTSTQGTNIPQLIFDANPFTIAFWVNSSEGDGGGGYGFITRGGGTPNSWSTSTDGTNNDKILFNSNSALVVASPNDMFNGTWNRIVYSREGTGANQFRMYVNNRNTANVTFSNNLSDNSDAFFIGSPNGASTGMSLDDILIYNNYAWTTADVNSDWNNGTGRAAESPDASPTITLNHPPNNTIYSVSPISIHFNATLEDDINITNGRLIINNILNYSANFTTNRSQLFTNISFTDGRYNWSVNTTDSNNVTISSLTRTFLVDGTSPTLNITFPINRSEINTAQITDVTQASIILNYTVNDLNLQSCWYYNNSANVSITCGNNISFILPYGNYLHYVYANDTAGNIVTKTTNVTYTYTFISNNISYNASSVESSVEGFRLNITYSNTTYPTLSSSFYYNNTLYSTTQTTSGSNTLITSSVTTPLLNSITNISFYWSLGFTNTTGTYYFNTSVLNQSVSPINMSILNYPYTVKFINYTLYDEDTLVPMTGSFSSTFNYGITSLVKNLSYSDISNTNRSWIFSFNPYDKTYLMTGTIELSKSGYNTKLYNQQQISVSNITTNVSLYLLNSSSGTQFVVKVLSTSYSPVSNAIVLVQRFYPSTNTYTTVDSLLTNSDGKDVSYFVTSTTNYRFLVYQNNVLTYTSVPMKIFCEVSPCTITLIIPSSASNPLSNFENLPNLTYSLTYSKATEVVTYSYTDTNTNAQGGRLQVVRTNLGIGSDVTICDTTSTNPVAVLTCSLNGLVNGTYIARGYNNRSTGSVLIKVISIDKTRNIVGEIGSEGVLWSALFLLSIVMLGLFSPVLAITFSIFGIIFLWMLGLMSITTLSLCAIIIVGIILLWEMKR